MRQVGPEIGRSKSVPDQAFVINCVDGLKIHMYIKYSVALSSFQLPSLAKVSQKAMLRPRHARSVIVMAKCPQSTLDDNISTYLHQVCSNLSSMGHWREGHKPGQNEICQWINFENAHRRRWRDSRASVPCYREDNYAKNTLRNLQSCTRLISQKGCSTLAI